MSAIPTIATAAIDSASVRKRCERGPELRAGVDDMPCLLSQNASPGTRQRRGSPLLSTTIGEFSGKARDETASGAREGVCRDPVPRDLLAPADPDVHVALDMIEKALQSLGSRGMADLPEMQADRHHLGRGLALAIEQIESVSAERKEIVGRREHAATELRVVVGERVGHHKMRPVTHLDPIRELVVVGVAVVEERTFLDEQSARVDA